MTLDLTPTERTLVNENRRLRDLLTRTECACAFYRACLEPYTVLEDHGALARKGMREQHPGAQLLADYRALCKRVEMLDHFSCWAVVTLEGYSEPVAGRVSEEIHLATPMIRIEVPGQRPVYDMASKVQDVTLLHSEQDVQNYLRGLGLPGEVLVLEREVEPEYERAVGG